MGSPYEIIDSPHITIMTAPELTTVETSFHSRLDYGTIEKDPAITGTHTNPTLAHRMFPTGFKREMKEIFALAWPTVITCLSINIVAPITIMFCGQLGRDQLDGVALSNSLVNVTGTSVITGMCTACDTLFAQAFGGKSKKLVGVYLQRSIFIVLMVCFLSWSVFVNTEGILLQTGQNPAVSKIAGEYALYFMPGLIFYALYQIFVKYIQIQNKVFPPVFIGIIGNTFNAVAHYIALFILGYGTRSSAIIQAMTYFLMSVLTMVYVFISGLYINTWPGWSWRALDNWSGFLKLAVPGVLMVIVEWWSYEVGVFASGILGDVALGALTVAFQLQSLNYVLPWGIAVACSIRVGQSLGAGNAGGAKTSALVSLVMAGMFFIGAGSIIMSLKGVIPILFTNDREVQELSTRMIPYIVLILMLNSVTATAGGILRGTGRQSIGAICNTFGYIFIGVPLELVLMFATNVGVIGFWLGLALGIAPVGVSYVIITLKTDWNKQVQKAEHRTNEANDEIGTSDICPLLFNIEASEIGLDTGPTPPPTFKELSYSKGTKIRLLIQFVLSTLVLLSIFLSGICIRVFLPLPSTASSVEFNTFFDNTTNSNSFVHNATDSSIPTIT